MRIWEFEDSRAIPSDLVREQDFILRLRRLHRLSTPHLVINLVLTAIESVSKSRRACEAMQVKLQEFAKITNASYNEMSNGDVFLTWEETADAQILSSRILAVILPGDHPASTEGSKSSAGPQDILITYHMPQDYAALRERANTYIEFIRTHASAVGDSPAEALKSISAQGPLTAWSVDQIGKLLADIDLKPYERDQAVCRRESNGAFVPIFEEHFIGFDDLRRDRFPKLEIDSSEHLFLALCELLDKQLITTMTENYDPLAHRALSFNISVSGIMGAVFAQFARTVPSGQRAKIGFEIHRGELLQDFALTLSAIELLKREGFKVTIDSVTPDVVGYMNLAAFKVDYIKINVSKDRATQLLDPMIYQSLSLIPIEKLIFFRCDNEEALSAGISLGVNLFQGWLIDEKRVKT